MKYDVTSTGTLASVLSAAVISGAIVIGFLLGFSVFYLIRSLYGVNSDSGLAEPQNSVAISLYPLSAEHQIKGN